MIKLTTAMRAGYTFFYAQTYEMDRTIDNIIDKIKSIKQKNWKTVLWDFEESGGDPDKVIEMLSASSPYTAIIAKNFNWFLEMETGEKNFNVIQFIQNRFIEFSSKDSRKVLIMVSDVDFNTAVPSCLRKEFITIDFPLPDKGEIKNILDDIIDAAKENPKFKKPTKQEAKNLIESALGLTKTSVSNSFAYSIIEGDGKMDPKVVANIRSAEINETSGLTVGNYEIEEIQGYNIAKEYIKKAIKNPNSCGVLLLGPPGVGKTHLAKWASTISSKIMIESELAEVQGNGLYGQAEQEMSNMIKIIKSIGNCVLFIDEIEKAVPGKGATNDTTGTRSFGQLLKFLSDGRPEGCFVIATCNDIQKLPPEWVRSGRFDVIFFADLPSDQEKEAIYNFYLDKYKVETGGFGISNMKDWTGAEIESACRIASIIRSDVEESAEYIVPVAKTMKDDIDYLRKWAKDRTIPANSPNKKVKRIRQMDI